MIIPKFSHQQQQALYISDLKIAAYKPEIPADQYRQLLRELNDKLRAMVMFRRNWCKKAVLALKEGKPYCVFVSGIGGIGIFHGIKLIHSAFLLGS